jgi:transposase
MRKIREALRLRHEMGLSKRAIAQSLSVSHSTIIELLGRAEAAGVSWPLPAELDDAALETKLYPGNPEPNIKRPMPDWSQVHQELRRKGVTLQLLWLEYRERHPDGYQYSHYCELYGAWCGKLEVVMRGRHLAGEEMLVDYVVWRTLLSRHVFVKVKVECPPFVKMLV